jgi:hypothetical protein
LEAKHGDVPQFGKLRRTSYQLVVLKKEKPADEKLRGKTRGREARENVPQFGKLRRTSYQLVVLKKEKPAEGEQVHWKQSMVTYRNLVNCGEQVTNLLY